MRLTLPANDVGGGGGTVDETIYHQGHKGTRREFVFLVG